MNGDENPRLFLRSQYTVLRNVHLTVSTQNSIVLVIYVRLGKKHYTCNFCILQLKEHIDDPRAGGWGGWWGEGQGQGQGPEGRQCPESCEIQKLHV